MAYLIEPDVDVYGMLDGGGEAFPINIIDHDWRMPYPATDHLIEFEWKEGDSREKPNIFRYPHMDNLVCDNLAYSVLMRCSPSDIHTIATGVLDGEQLFIIQAINIIDNIVDRESSIIEKRSNFEILRFPAFYRTHAPAIANRIFRVPENFFMVFVGEDVKQALDEENVSGLRYVPADWAD